jgi:hypothetical protein
MSAMISSPPKIVDGMPSIAELEAEWANAGTGMVAITTLARDIGADPSSMRKRARKMGLLLEQAWVRDSKGCRQSTVCTDAAGAAALRVWYAK